MSDGKGRNRPMNNRNARRGQALIIVLAVMFVLLFIGTIFIAQIGRNIQQSGRSVQTQTANTLAEAGVNYCDEQLTHSGDGADWRPTPTPPISNTDPDYQWLSVGFSRVAMNGGRALVRVVYAPDTQDPRGGLLRIESIGRPGDIGDGTDPTVFLQRGAAPRLRKELVAYKQIGLTDYGLYVTNKNKTNNEASIGVPDLHLPDLRVPALGETGIGPTAPLSLVLGDPSVGVNKNLTTPSYPMRVNGDVKFYGSTYLFESQRNTGDNLLTADTLLASGNIVFDNANTRLFVNEDLTKKPAPLAQASQGLKIGPNGDANCAVNPTSANPACAFDSANGLVRTGSDQPDSSGYSQGIRSLDPPSLDYYDAGTGFLRYRLLTRETGAFATDADKKRFRQGQFGWGTGVYINNPTDYQAESNAAGVGSSYSLRADWLNPKANFANSSWQGPYYRPPGVTIELLGDRMRITRDDNESFYGPDGLPSVTQGSKSIEIPFSDYERKNYVLPNGALLTVNHPALQAFPHDGDDRDAVLSKNGLKNPYTHTDTYGVNVVVMLEGNVKVRGVFGADASNISEAENPDTEGSKKLERVHLTIVSGRTAYIEGNIVKGDPDKASTCAILARDYVCVNTTQFMQARNQTNLWTAYSENIGSFVSEIGPGTSVPSFDASFSFGLDPTVAYPPAAASGASPVKLLLRSASYHGNPTLINLLINPAIDNDPTKNRLGFYDFSKSIFPAIPPPIVAQTDALTVNTFLPSGLSNTQNIPFKETYALGYTYLGTSLTGFATLPKLEGRSFPLAFDTAASLNSSYTLLARPGYENLLRFQVDTTAAGRSGNSLLSGGSDDYAFGGAMVTPLDIRIEAMLYAQERSFFVIPGYAFNPDKDDTARAYLLNNNSRPFTYGQTTRVAADFPFYNEPLDVRITVYGTIAENYTASISDQAAWMTRWGYIPEYSGAGGVAVGGGNTAGMAIPNIHLRGTEPGTTPGVKDGAEYRTKDEADAKIARGMRFLYDPLMVSPYAESAQMLIKSKMLPTNQTGLNPVRFLSQPLFYNNNGVMVMINSKYRQALPPLPKLPVCPGKLYEGTPAQPLG